MNSTTKKIELLAPAKNLETGVAAINCGADAVYIGAPKFGARAAVGNSIDDIENLVKYSHQYYAKTFVTVNTLLYDSELDAARRMIKELYDCGVDAIIFQDMALLEMDIPPIPLYASTQTHNYELSRIKFLDDLGIKRIILARELSLNQIQEIRKQTKAELEFFIHGALCVCLSGQCYLSHAITGRSANRGECSQPCRMKYTLTDKQGKVIIQDKHLLSLKDLNLSSHLNDLIDAGINSFKIEGRLKDVSYIKNITSYYRQLLDNIIASRSGIAKSSSGKSYITFTPDPNKTFNRGYSEYFLEGQESKLANIDTPKSMGEYLGKITKLTPEYFETSANIKVTNGDGLCFFDESGELAGFNVNKTDGSRIYYSDQFKLHNGQDIYRNFDKAFSEELANPVKRKIDVQIILSQSENRITFTALDEDSNTFTYSLENTFEMARNVDQASETIKKQISKSGETSFNIVKVTLNLTTVPFIPVGILNEARRELLNFLMEKRVNNYIHIVYEKPEIIPSYPSSTLDYKGNVTNKYSLKFYNKAGVSEIEDGFEISSEHSDKTLMRCKYCIREELNICPKQDGESNEDLFLLNNNNKFIIKFNCSKCEMNIQITK